MTRVGDNELLMKREHTANELVKTPNNTPSNTLSDRTTTCQSLCSPALKHTVLKLRRSRATHLEAIFLFFEIVWIFVFIKWKNSSDISSWVEAGAQSHTPPPNMGGEKKEKNSISVNNSTINTHHFDWFNCTRICLHQQLRSSAMCGPAEEGRHEVIHRHLFSSKTES